MKDSIKANLIVFSIIALIAFGVSSALVNLTVHEDNDSYKLIPLEDDSFEPNYINKVPTIVPKNTTNTTNATNTTNDTIEDVIDYNDTIADWNDTYTELEELYEDYEEY